MTADTSIILVVEDERNLLELFAQWLEGEYEVRTATDGETGMAQLEPAVDAILLDRRLPGVSGDRLVDRMRAEVDYPIGLISAVEPDFDLLTVAFDGHLTKPVAVDEFRSLVQRLLKVAGLAPEVRDYYRLLIKRSVLEANKPYAELDGHPRYRAIVDELEAVEDGLEAAQIETARSLVG